MMPRNSPESPENDSLPEMMPDEIEKLLNDELSKPESEMDVQLVDRLLAALEPVTPDSKRMKEDWAGVRSELPGRKARRRAARALGRATAVIAVIAVALLSTLESADAFRWTFIQKILTPVAETFGIYVNTQATPSPTEAPSSPREEGLQIPLSSLSDVPETVEGYPVRPSWLPGGLAFSSGSAFSNPDVTIYSMDFAGTDAWMNLVVHVFTSEEAVSSYEFELTMKSPVEAPIGPYQVTYYSNAHSHLQSASWVYENAHYLLVGQITQEDMFQFIEHLQ